MNTEYSVLKTAIHAVNRLWSMRENLDHDFDAGELSDALHDIDEIDRFEQLVARVALRFNITPDYLTRAMYAYANDQYMHHV